MWDKEEFADWDQQFKEWWYHEKRWLLGGNEPTPAFLDGKYRELLLKYGLLLPIYYGRVDRGSHGGGPR